MNGYMNENHKYVPPNYADIRRRARKRKLLRKVNILVILVLVAVLLNSSARAGATLNSVYLPTTMNGIMIFGWPCMLPGACDGDSHAMGQK